ncbi:ATP-binding protein [Sphingomonas lutea]|uniref:ATP-binding protein n=1 Tax=Sphingomonas lutea TaxID=1045317 RepID=A0A7G9SFI0_9SPHN|nr:ATP-binding protein [Sphingomonas lutea]QNN66605.1 ATP-binding protein [Sphingomonas lutea]
MGNATVIYTVVIVAVVWLFHRQSPNQVFAILGAWLVISLRPIEHLFDLIRWVGNRPTLPPRDIVGHLCAYQSPGIVLLRQTDNRPLSCGTVLLLSDEYGPSTAGVVLNEVGRDEGNLVRVLSQPFPEGHVAPVGKPGTAQVVAFTEEQRAAVPILSQITSLCGIVDTDTDLLTLQMEVIDGQELAEGRLVEASIGTATVLYQIIQGVTRDEIVQQKNKYGYVRAAARKIGTWDADAGRFRPVAWLPPINSPVFLRQKEDAPVEPEAVGHFPDTTYHMAYSPSDGVTHNTAILGILGVGKSFLALELVERMLAAGIKVLCLDLTNQYAVQLAAFLDADHEKKLDEQLRAAGEGRQVKPDVEAGGSRPAFRAKVREQLKAFLDPASGRNLRILNPSQFEVSRQDSKPYAGNAAMATLTAAEITAIFSEEALTACQEMGMTDDARLCLVYEEAHTLVPEWNSVAADGDKQATAASARAILQGRKYGLGCLLITQRTANVTKSILNQCNTVFALRSFDETSREFLSNYIGRDYAQVLPTLPQRHAVFFGKASSSSNPVMIRVNDREAFLDAFRAAHPPPPLPRAAAPGEAAAGVQGAADAPEAQGRTRA